MTTTERLLAWRITHPMTGAVQYGLDPVLEQGSAKPGHVLVQLDGRLHCFPEADAKRVTDDRGTVYSYHSLLLATGGDPRRLPLESDQVIYYRGFDEQEITAATPFAGVPWLDASVRLEGPLVEAVELGFLADWVQCGGAPFAVEPLSRPAGRSFSLGCPAFSTSRISSDLDIAVMPPPCVR